MASYRFALIEPSAVLKTHTRLPNLSPTRKELSWSSRGARFTTFLEFDSSAQTISPPCRSIDGNYAHIPALACYCYSEIHICPLNKISGEAKSVAEALFGDVSNRKTRASMRKKTAAAACAGINAFLMSPAQPLLLPWWWLQHETYTLLPLLSSRGQWPECDSNTPLPFYCKRTAPIVWRRRACVCKIMFSPLRNTHTNMNTHAQQQMLAINPLHR